MNNGIHNVYSLNFSFPYPEVWPLSTHDLEAQGKSRQLTYLYGQHAHPFCDSPLGPE